MKLYCGIDLHSNNSVVVVIDEQDKLILSKKCANDISVIHGQLAPFSEDIQSVVVESTYNWYWLVDGLEDAGFQVQLANTAAIQQYSGIKHTDDKSDARFLANLIRLDILPAGHIMPREQRNIRDLLRKRSLLIKQRTMLNLNLQGMIARHTGTGLSANQMKRLNQKGIEELMAEQVVRDSAMINLMQIEAINKSVKLLEQRVSGYCTNTTENKLLQSIPGVGQILSQMIALESGSMDRFPDVRNYSSYVRCVPSKKISNGKTKGTGNRKNGNPWLAWAFMEAAHLSAIWSPEIKKYYQRKASKSHILVAKKSVANKLARAVYHMLKQNTVFDVKRAFA
mgnify:CR=1 FL=1